MTSTPGFRVHGTLLSEARSIPPGAFAVTGVLTIADGWLALARTDAAMPGSKLKIELPTIVRSRVVRPDVYVEWAAADGIVSGLNVRLDDDDQWHRLARSVERRLPRQSR